MSDLKERVIDLTQFQSQVRNALVKAQREAKKSRQATLELQFQSALQITDPVQRAEELLKIDQEVNKWCGPFRNDPRNR